MKKQKKEESGKTTTEPLIKRQRQIADLAVFDKMPERSITGRPDSEYFCSHCWWLILPDEKHKKKQFAPGVWLMIHDDCFEKPEFKKKIEQFKNKINEIQKKTSSN